jgi:hypothetical protein
MKEKSQFSAKSIRGDDCGYVAFHSPRYAFLLQRLDKYNVTSNTKLLDIGPSRLTTLMHEKFRVYPDSLGFGTNTLIDGARHFEFDLNLTQNTNLWMKDLPQYEFVVMAEVIEHLYTAPSLVLSFIKTLLVENGLLIIQTPNAASLPKRLKLLRGHNPYEMLRVDPSDPGHFREYTISELYKLAEEMGFCVELCLTSFYFDARFARHEVGNIQPQPILGSIKNFLYQYLPKDLREGVTMIWRKSNVP